MSGKITMLQTCLWLDLFHLKDLLKMATLVEAELNLTS